MNKLSELTVIVKTLNVDGKKMTQSFFKQLPIGHVYKDDHSLRDVNFWGSVRYKIDDTPTWVLFEKDEILYKGNPNPDNYMNLIEDQEVEIEYIQKRIVENSLELVGYKEELVKRKITLKENIATNKSLENIMNVTLTEDQTVDVEYVIQLIEDNINDKVLKEDMMRNRFLLVQHINHYKSFEKIIRLAVEDDQEVENIQRLIDENIKKSEKLKEQFVDDQIELLKCINADKSVKYIKSLQQIFIAI
ncbi:hypothetical protein HN385_07335 [archaeon]|nr:hypothetical protein [archaeon]